jgi:hypothetical protein
VSNASNADHQSSKVTHRINAKALELLDQYPDGLSWADLLSAIKSSDSKFHPKTINGCIWKLTQKFPELVYKPSRGLFRLRKYDKANK